MCELIVALSRNSVGERLNEVAYRVLTRSFLGSCARNPTMSRSKLRTDCRQSAKDWAHYASHLEPSYKRTHCIWLGLDELTAQSKTARRRGDTGIAIRVNLQMSQIVLVIDIYLFGPISQIALVTRIQRWRRFFGHGYGFRARERHNRRDEVHEEAKTEPLSSVQGTGGLGGDSG
jgi:hypothetical protein